MTKASKVATFKLKYNLTSEELMDRHGVVTDAQLLKAQEIIDLGLITDAGQDKHGAQLWAVLPIPGYNITTYTCIVRMQDNGRLLASCNCQYCTMRSRMCSHLLAVLLDKGHWGKDVEVIGGIRGKRAKGRWETALEGLTDESQGKLKAALESLPEDEQDKLQLRVINGEEEWF